MPEQITSFAQLNTYVKNRINRVYNLPMLYDALADCEKELKNYQEYLRNH